MRNETFRDALSVLIKVLVFSALPVVACIANDYLPRLHYKSITATGVHAEAAVFCPEASLVPAVHVPASTCIARAYARARDPGSWAPVKNDLALEDISVPPLFSNNELVSSPALTGDHVKVTYDPDDPDDIVVEHGIVHSKRDGDFSISATFAQRSLFDVLMQVGFGTIFMAIVLRKLLLAVAVAIESFFGIDSGPDHYGLAD